MVTLALTERGRRLVSKVPEVAQGLLLTGLEGLSPRDLKAVADGLEVLMRILRAHRLPPRLLFSSDVSVHAGGTR